MSGLVAGVLCLGLWRLCCACNCCGFVVPRLVVGVFWVSGGWVCSGLVVGGCVLGLWQCAVGLAGCGVCVRAHGCMGVHWCVWLGMHA